MERNGLAPLGVIVLDGLSRGAPCPCREARYFKNKYDHVFTVEPAAKAKKAIEWVHRILKEERDIAIASPPLEATTIQVEKHPGTYVFYENGLSINIPYPLADRRRQRRLQALRRHGGPRRAWLVQVREAEVEAGRDHPRARTS